MEIHCSNIKKKFRKEILFHSFNYQFESGKSYAILGPNSSGKSTLLRIIGGVLEANEGVVKYEISGKTIAKEQVYQYLSFAAPAMELLQDYTVSDLAEFHFSLKKCKFDISDVIDKSGLSNFRHKTYAELSSGLRNKVKLSLAIFTDSPVLLLDEPCTNFDDENTKWYQEMISSYCQGQTLIIASNKEEEYKFCEHRIYLKDYKN
ncbi:ATP-binding cassette domain-containing protein [bacterium]|nr:ATP-binding cassette domain-containing protein [bacterium]